MREISWMKLMPWLHKKEDAVEKQGGVLKFRGKNLALLKPVEIVIDFGGVIISQ